MNKDQIIEAHRAMGQEVRFDIIKFLGAVDEAQTVEAIARHIAAKPSTVSTYLQQLKRCNFVHCIVSGKHRFYSLNKETIRTFLADLHTLIGKL